MKNSNITFSLILSNVSEITDALEDALFEAGCDNALIFSKNKIVYLDFVSDTNNFKATVNDAINSVEKIGYKAARVEPADLVTASEIARRINKSREYVRLLINGERGKGNFPIPLAGVTTKTNIWSWLEVVNWLYRENKLEDIESIERAEIIWSINRTLETRKYSERLLVE